MKKLLVVILLSCMLLGGCSDQQVVISVENTENINNNVLGKSALRKISDSLYYDSTTRIVYWWNGWFYASYSATTPTPYYAPNGLPYKYNPESNTFEEIKYE